MSDPQPQPDVGDKPGLPAYQPAIPTAPEKKVPQPESSAEGEPPPDQVVKPGMSIGA